MSAFPLVTIVGGGNVACHLEKALSRTLRVKRVNPHTLEGYPADTDVCLLCVSDDAISSVAQRLDDFGGIVAHTSGTTPMGILDRSTGNRHGVVYPLQTFSKDVPLDYDTIPVFVEGNDEDVTATLTLVAQAISPDVHILDSERRKALHLASVFACNFANHLWTLSAGWLEDNGIDPAVLRPLIGETVAKLDRATPLSAQTGPARRGDMKTIGEHLRMLDANPSLQKIYTQLTDSIMSLYNKI